MLISMPDHYASSVAGAMVHRAAEVMEAVRIVPAWLYQFADLWDRGLNYGVSDVTFWQAVADHNKDVAHIMRKAGAL